MLMLAHVHDQKIKIGEGPKPSTAWSNWG